MVTRKSKKPNNIKGRIVKSDRLLETSWGFLPVEEARYAIEIDMPLRLIENMSPIWRPWSDSTTPFAF